MRPVDGPSPHNGIVNSCFNCRFCQFDDLIPLCFEPSVVKELDKSNRKVGDKWRTPQWCPYLKENNL